MRGIRDFIIEVKAKNNDTITTKNGVKIHVDKRWNQKETANTVAKVVELPFGYEGPIKKGYNLFIDPTIFFEQIYTKGGKQSSPNLIDAKKGLYKIPHSMIICYSEGEGTMWNGNNDNVIVYKFIEEKEEEPLKKIGSIIIPNTSHKEVSAPKYRVLIANDSLEGVVSGDEIIINNEMAVDVFLRGEKYSWIRNKDILAVVYN